MNKTYRYETCPLRELEELRTETSVTYTTIAHYPGECRACSEDLERLARGRLSAVTEAPKPDYHGPDNSAHREVYNVTEHLLAGRVTSAGARKGLRDALDKADAIKPRLAPGVKPFAGSAGRGGFTRG